MAAKRAASQYREIQEALKPITQTAQLRDMIQSDAVKQALATRNLMIEHRSTSERIKELTGSSMLAEQIKAARAITDNLTPARSAVAEIAALKGSNGVGSAIDLIIGPRHGSLIAASQAAQMSAFATKGAVTEALKVVRTMPVGAGFLTGLRHDRAAQTALREIEAATTLSLAALRVSAPAGILGRETFARAAKWSVEASIVGTSLDEMLRETKAREREQKALMAGATLAASSSWRTMMDGVIGASLASLRPATVSAYAGLHHAALPIAARSSTFALPLTTSTVARQISDHLAELQRQVSEMMVPLRSGLTASRAPDAVRPDHIPDRELIAVAIELEQAMTEVSEAGTLEALLRFLDVAFAAFSRNTARELNGVGAITLLSLLSAVLQLVFWLQPAWTPAPEATQPPGIERLQQEQRALSEKFDSLTEMLAQQEAENLNNIPRVRVKTKAKVRTGPATSYPSIGNLEAGEVVGTRDRENGWVLVFYRDPLTTALESGWIYAKQLERDAE